MRPPLICASAALIDCIGDGTQDIGHVREALHYYTTPAFSNFLIVVFHEASSLSLS